MIRLAALASVAVVTCFGACSLNVDYTGTNYQCNADGTCPTNFVCESKVCVPTDPVPPACSKAVAAGDEHACAVRNDGTVWCWGANDFGQLGDGTATDSNKPVQVQMVTNAVAVGAGGSSSCELDKKGDVWCWGHNDAGELGDGTTSDSRTPVQVKNVSGATALAVGSEHACALGGDGSVLCWGSNDHGELGDGTTSNRNMASAVPGLPPATAIAAGDDTTCAVDGMGALRCWGLNGDGQLGDGTMNDKSTPTAVMMLPPVVGAAAGGGFTCANDAGGAVWCWGNDDNAQLGNGTQGTSSMLPVQVDAAVPLHALVAGGGQACGTDDQKRLWCWGIDYDARLGDGVFAGYRGIPVLSLMSDTISMSAGGEHTCAVDAKGAIRCAGFNRRGQLGNGQRVTQGAPQQVPGVTGASAIAAGGGQTCALITMGGTVKCWGQNDSGQVGNGSVLVQASAVDVAGLGNVTELVAGGDHTCAVSDGNVFCWGADDASQLGTMSTFDSPVPLYAGQLGQMPKALVLGNNTTCTVKGGQALCVGDTYGDTVTVAGGFTDVAEVAVGRAHTCVLRTSGAVECWGSDSNGQLGDGSCCTGSSTPSVVPGLSGVMHVYARNNNTCVLMSDGSAKCWGYDDNYRVGNGQSLYEVSSPAPVMGLAGAMSLAVGYDASCARKADGSVWCWGPGYYGEIGDGQYQSRGMAVQVPGLSGVMQVATGGSHACALLGDGTVSCWGLDDQGQLGDGVYARAHPSGVQMTCP